MAPTRKAWGLAGEGGGHSPPRWWKPQALLNVPITLTATCCNKAMTIPAELLGPCGGRQGSPPPRGHKTLRLSLWGQCGQRPPHNHSWGSPVHPVSPALPLLGGHTDPTGPHSHACTPSPLPRPASGPPHPADVTAAPPCAVSVKSECPETQDKGSMRFPPDPYPTTALQACCRARLCPND